MNILLTDDDELIRNNMSLVLQREGHRCDVACDGKDCLKKMAQNLYDVLLLDMIMPEMDGEQVLRAMGGRFPGTDVVIISAQDDDAIIQQTMHLGAVAYMLKPAEPKAYVALVQQLAADRQRRSTQSGIQSGSPTLGA